MADDIWALDPGRRGQALAEVSEAHRATVKVALIERLEHKYRRETGGDA